MSYNKQYPCGPILIVLWFTIQGDNELYPRGQIPHFPLLDNSLGECHILLTWNAKSTKMSDFAITLSFETKCLLFVVRTHFLRRNLSDSLHWMACLLKSVTVIEERRHSLSKRYISLEHIFRNQTLSFSPEHQTSKNCYCQRAFTRKHASTYKS